MQGRSADEHTSAMAASNSAVVQLAARALIRNCDTLSLLRSPGDATGSGRGGSKGGSEQFAQGVGDAAAAAAAGGRISALLCFDEVQVDPAAAFR